MTRMLGFVLAVLFVATGVQAQDVALRFYIVPKDTHPALGIMPKYIGSLPVSWSAMDYGRDDTFLVGANVSSAQHTMLAANLDVIAIPQNLDATIGLTALTQVQDALEGLHIPGGWVTTNHTYRDVIRLVGKLFVVMQRFSGLHGRTFFEMGITLNTRINELTQAQRQDLIETAASLGLDTSVVTQTMTLRQALKLIGDQIPSFGLAGQTF